MSVNWENPKEFLPLLLFFGIILVLVGTGIQSITANTTLALDGWIVVVVAVILWIFSKLLES